MKKRRHNIVMVCCSVLKTEIKLLCKEKWPDHDFRFLNSMLHMTPEILGPLLKSVVDEERSKGNKVIIVYGDCCQQMASIENQQGVARTLGNNCCDLILGREEYRRMSREGAFFMMPEWTQRWKEVFMKHLGMTPENTTNFMQEMHHELIYLNTGVVQIPEKELMECSKYCGLPYEIRQVSLMHLKGAIEDALLRLEGGSDDGTK